MDVQELLVFNSVNSVGLGNSAVNFQYCPVDDTWMRLGNFFAPRKCFYGLGMLTVLFRSVLDEKLPQSCLDLGSLAFLLQAKISPFLRLARGKLQLLDWQLQLCRLGF